MTGAVDFEDRCTPPLTTFADLALSTFGIALTVCLLLAAQVKVGELYVKMT